MRQQLSARFLSTLRAPLVVIAVSVLSVTLRAEAPSVGTISTIAGNGSTGFSGDGSSSASAQLSAPVDAVSDSAGNVYISDRGNHRIRKVDAHTGVITTIAGTGTAGFSGDGGPADSAQLSQPSGLAIDTAGNLLIADAGNHRIRRISASTGIIATVAGSGAAGFTGDGSSAMAAALNGPLGVAIDEQGNLYIADSGNFRVRKVQQTSGTIATLAGTGISAYAGEGVALAVPLSLPSDVVVDGSGAVYIADTGIDRIRRVDQTTGVISTVAGLHYHDYAGEAVAATTATLHTPLGLAVDSLGNVYFADSGNHRVRKITVATGVITTVAGNAIGAFRGDAGVATAASLSGPRGVSLDARGRLLIADTANNRIRKVSLPHATMVLTTIAGTGVAGYNGDGAGRSAQVKFPEGVALDDAGNVYFADTLNQRIRKLESGTGLVSTIAGTGAAGYAGDGAASTTQFHDPNGIAVDASGNLYVADTRNHRIRKLSSGGIVTTVAGNGTVGFTDGIAATAAALNYPFDVAVDSAGNLFIADAGNNRVRKVDAATGLIATVVGTGSAGYSGDGGSGAAAQLNFPRAVAVDASANVYVADTLNGRVRKLSAATGHVSTVAGSGVSGYTGENVAATAAALTPKDIAVDALGNLYIADTARVRKVDAQTGLLTTVMGNGAAAFANSDGGAATAGQLGASGVAVNAQGSVLVVTDGENARIRKANYLPTPPGSLILTRTALTHVQLNWTAAPGATSYIVKRGVQPGGETTIASNVNATSYEDVGVIGTRYYYVVSALFDTVESANSIEAAVLFTRATTQSDADGDGQSDVMLFRPSVGYWFVRNSGNGYAVGQGNWQVQWGATGDLPLQADFDGDGKLDPAVYRPGTGQWFIRYSSQGYDPAQFGYLEWGAAGDVPLTADFDSDGKADAVAFRPSTGQWFIRYSSNGYAADSYGYFEWGASGDAPRLGDYDGDGRPDVAVYRTSTGQWFMRLSSRGYDPALYGYFAWGLPTDTPLAADFDGDGATDVAVYRPSTGEWFILRSSAGFDSEQSLYFQWGASGDLPVLADFDADGRTDVSVYRPTTGQWFMRVSGTGYSASQFGYFEWGTTGDTPIPLN